MNTNTENRTLEDLRKDLANLKPITHFHQQYPEHFSASTIEWMLRNPNSIASKLVVRVNNTRKLPEDKMLTAAIAGEL